MSKTSLLMTGIFALPLAFSGEALAQTPAKKPNIIMIMADDVGIWNISAYHRGMMGGSTPNIDRIASEGALFTVTEGPRKEFFYFTDGGDLNALRYNEWKISFKTVKGNLFTGREESTNVPIVTNLRQDPWERYQDLSMNYGKWWGEKLWTMVPAVNIVGRFLLTFKEYPPSQVSGTLTVDKAVAMIAHGASGGGK
jgi:hypothetical protein